MTRDAHFNRSNRRSGGPKKTLINVPQLTTDDLAVLRQESEVRREFGEEGVRLFWKRMEELASTVNSASPDSTKEPEGPK
jgi:hypothetical protein